MVLFVNKSEVDALKQALRDAKPADPETRFKQDVLLERVCLREALANNISRSNRKLG